MQLKLADGSGQVIVDYEVYDSDDNTVTVSLEFWNDAIWSAATTVSGDEGAGIDANSSTTKRSITWEADTDLGAIEVSNYNVRVIATDGVSADTVSRSSNDLIIDTQDPTGYACSTPANASSPSGPDVTLTSAVASDISTIEYYIEYDDSPDCLSPLGNSDWQSEDYDWVAIGLGLGSTYYWRVNARDSYGNVGTPSAIFSFTVDNSKPNVVIDNVTVATNGTGLVTVQYDLTDPQAPENCELLIKHSADGLTWYQSYINSASVGTIDNTNVSSGGATRQIHTISTNQSNVTFVWASQNASNENGAITGEDATYYIRITPKDASANTGSTVSSIAFILDNQDPTGHTCSSPSDAATGISPNPTLTCNAATDISSVQYYFELDIDETWDTPLQNSGWQGGTTWAPAALSYDTQYFWRVKAKDSYGNEAAFEAVFDFTCLDGWVYPAAGTIGACSSPALGDGDVYIGTGGADDKVYCLDVDDGTLNWSYQADGDVYNVSCYYYSGAGKYAVYFSTSNSSVYALWDDGASNSDKFASNPVPLGGIKATTEVIPDIDGSNLYLGWFKDGYKLSATDGSEVWNTFTPDISPSATSAPVIGSAFLFFAASANTYKFLADGTASGNTGVGANTPLGAWNGVLYIASPDNFVYAFNWSTCSQIWQSQDLGGQTYTGATRGFIKQTGDVKLYVAADDDLVTINTTNGNITYSRTVAVGNTINSTPIVGSDGTTIYFGCDDSKAYAVDSSSTLSDLSGWPNTAGGPISATPAVDEANNVAIFGSNEGKVYGYFLQ